MKTFKHHLTAAFLAVLLCTAFTANFLAPSAAMAQQFAGRSYNIRVLGSADCTAGTTFATTSYADCTGASITFTPAKDYATTEAPGTPASVPHLHLLWSADVTKATATTMTCALYVNGAVLAKTARTVTVLANASMTSFADVAEATSGSQTVKVQCKSGDTNTGTVNNGTLYAEEVY